MRSHSTFFRSINSLIPSDLMTTRRVFAFRLIDQVMRASTCRCDLHLPTCLSLIFLG